MKLPSYRRLYKQDFNAEDQALIERLSGSLNINIEVLYDALNKKVSLEDNLFASVRTFNVTVNANGLPITPTSFQIDKLGTIKGLIILNANNITNSNIYPLSGIFITYEQRGQQIIVKHVTGLPADNTFTITVAAMG